MTEKRLLERLQENTFTGKPPGEFEQLATSIIENLKRILNTRRGTVRTDPDFGIPDFTLLSGGISAVESDLIEATIQKIVQKYEPRLLDSTVLFDGSSFVDLRLRFRLEGSIVYGKKKFAVQLKSQMSANNTFDVIQTNESFQDES